MKIIGATAHYVIEELDAGPIIEQDVARVSHRESVEELERIGGDIERVVLARAVDWHVAGPRPRAREPDRRLLGDAKKPGRAKLRLPSLL